MSKEVEAFGETKSITEWSRDPRCKVSPYTIRQRLERGIPEEQAVLLPVMRKRPEAQRCRPVQLPIPDHMWEVLDQICHAGEYKSQIITKFVAEGLRRRGLWEGLTPGEFERISSWLDQHKLFSPDLDVQREMMLEIQNHLSHKEIGILLDPGAEDPRSLSAERYERLGIGGKKTTPHPEKSTTLEAGLEWLTKGSVLDLLMEHPDTWWGAREVADTIVDTRDKKLRKDAARTALRRLYSDDLLIRKKVGRRYVYQMYPVV